VRKSVFSSWFEYFIRFMILLHALHFRECFYFATRAVRGVAMKTELIG